MDSKYHTISYVGNPTKLLNQKINQVIPGVLGCEDWISKVLPISTLLRPLRDERQFFPIFSQNVKILIQIMRIYDPARELVFWFRNFGTL